jgi:hypothetical protein
LKVDRGITSEDVIDTLAEPIAMRSVPQAIRSNNGPEFIARTIQRWLAQVDVQTLYVEARGRLALPIAFTAGYGMSSWPWKCLRI